MARTIDGRDWMSDRLHGDAPQDGEAQIICLFDDPDAPTSAWSFSGGPQDPELAANGFSRAVADYAHVAGASTSTLNHIFTHSGPSGGGTPVQVNAVGVVAYLNGVTPPGAAGTGILVFAMPEPNPPTLTGTDSLDQTVLIDFGS